MLLTETSSGASSLTLNPAPRTDSPSPNPFLNPMALKLPSQVMEKMMKGAQVEMDMSNPKAPVLIVGGERFTLLIQDETSHVDVYQSHPPSKRDKSPPTLEYKGQIKQKLHVKPSSSNTSRFKNIAAEEEKARGERKAVFLDRIPPTGKGGLSKLSKKPTSNLMRKLKAPSTGSAVAGAVSAAAGTSTSEAVLAAARRKPPVQLTDDPALRRIILHLLAEAPATAAALAQKIKRPEAAVLRELKKIADPQRLDNRIYQLKKASYQDLSPWEFHQYDEQQRERAIRNAIIAFDTLKIPPDAPERKRLMKPGTPPGSKTLPVQSAPLLRPSSVHSLPATSSPKRQFHHSPAMPSSTLSAQHPSPALSESAQDTLQFIGYSASKEGGSVHSAPNQSPVIQSPFLKPKEIGTIKSHSLESSPQKKRASSMSDSLSRGSTLSKGKGKLATSAAMAVDSTESSSTPARQKVPTTVMKRKSDDELTSTKKQRNSTEKATRVEMSSTSSPGSKSKSNETKSTPSPAKSSTSKQQSKSKKTQSQALSRSKTNPVVDGDDDVPMTIANHSNPSAPVSTLATSLPSAKKSSTAPKAQPAPTHSHVSASTSLSQQTNKKKQSSQSGLENNTQSPPVYTEADLSRMSRKEIVSHLQKLSTYQNVLYKKIQQFMSVGAQVTESIRGLEESESLALIQNVIGGTFSVSNEVEFLEKFGSVMNKYNAAREQFELGRRLLRSGR